MIGAMAPVMQRSSPCRDRRALALPVQAAVSRVTSSRAVAALADAQDAALPGGSDDSTQHGTRRDLPSAESYGGQVLLPRK